MPFLRSAIKPGVHYIFRGEVLRRSGTCRMEQPKIMTEEEYLKKQAALQPLYPLTKGLSTNVISKAVGGTLPELYSGIDYLSEGMRKEHGLMGLKGAIEEIHFPKSECIAFRKTLF